MVQGTWSSEVISCLSKFVFIVCMLIVVKNVYENIVAFLFYSNQRPAHRSDVLAHFAFLLLTTASCVLYELTTLTQCVYIIYDWVHIHVHVVYVYPITDDVDDVNLRISDRIIHFGLE